MAGLSLEKGLLWSKTVVAALAGFGMLVPDIVAEVQTGDLHNAAYYIVTAFTCLAAAYGRIVAKAKIVGVV